MSTIVNVPKNGSLANVNSASNFPTWSNWIDEILNRDLPSVFTSNFNTGLSLPKVNIKETADEYLVEMAVPGLKKSDFHIDLDNEILTIQTELQHEKEQQEENYVRREFGYSSFKRSFNLPESVDGGKINARYNNGILSLVMPKKEEAKRKPVKSIKIS